MSNLGWYQVMTTAAKKVGGPLILFGLTALSGGIASLGIEHTVKRIKSSIKTSKIYVVLKDGQSDKGLQLKIGDEIRILNEITDGYLIEKIGDKNNPYVVSKEFLKELIEEK